MTREQQFSLMTHSTDSQAEVSELLPALALLYCRSFIVIWVPLLASILVVAIRSSFCAISWMHYPATSGGSGCGSFRKIPQDYLLFVSPRWYWRLSLLAFRLDLASGNKYKFVFKSLYLLPIIYCWVSNCINKVFKYQCSTIEFTLPS